MLLALAGAVALALVLSGAVTVSAATGAHSGPVSQAVTVEPGQTLWEIAVAVDPGVDPRVTVWRIQQLNDLQDGSVRAGQRLYVPSS